MGSFILISALGTFIGLAAGEKNNFTDVGRINNAWAGFLGATAGMEGISAHLAGFGYDPQLLTTQAASAAIGAFILHSSLGLFANFGRV